MQEATAEAARSQEALSRALSQAAKEEDEKEKDKEGEQEASEAASKARVGAHGIYRVYVRHEPHSGDPLATRARSLSPS